MKGFRPATEAEVVLAFLRGEIDSDRFGHDVERDLSMQAAFSSCDVLT